MKNSTVIQYYARNYPRNSFMLYALQNLEWHRVEKGLQNIQYMSAPNKSDLIAQMSN